MTPDRPTPDRPTSDRPTAPREPARAEPPSRPRRTAQLLDAGDWAPIGTAPLDGRDLLVGFSPGGRQLVARWSVDHHGWVAVDEHVFAPTHWQALPAPPPEVVAEAPVVTALTPTSAALGDPDFTLHVTGTGFLEDAVILWNGSPEPTTVLSPTELTTAVNMATASVALPIPVAVQNGDGPLSNALVFNLTEAGAARRR